jgi:lisH domain-containing protein FOPNL
LYFFPFSISALKETLERNGSLSDIRARLRSEIYRTLDDNTEPKPDIPADNFVINELIREYLDFNKCAHTKAVFLAETGQPKEPLGRAFLARQLNAPDDQHTQAVYYYYYYS